jgi:acetyl esterase
MHLSRSFGAFDASVAGMSSVGAYPSRIGGHKWLRAVAGSAAVATGTAVAVSNPRVGALLMRGLFTLNGRRVRRALQAHYPAGITVVRDHPYRTDDTDATFDVYCPTATPSGQCLPTVVWTHGGAWLSGDKVDADGYFALIASYGFTVVAINYSLAPESTYPKPVLQLNSALDYLMQDPEWFHIDSRNFVLAGDSAGAQLTSQIACLTTDPIYAESVGVPPALEAEQLKGVVLHCGLFDLRKLVDGRQAAPAAYLRWGLKTMVAAYSGSRATDSSAIREMSTIDHVGPSFPPAFLSGGNGDALTDSQSRPMAKKLKDLGVQVATLFYDEDHRPVLPHEYQFNLNVVDGRNALMETVTFVRRCTSTS